MTLVEIATLENLDTSETAVRAWVDAPTPGGYDRTALEVRGWVFANGARAVAVEVFAGRVLRTIPLALPRPEVQERFPEAPIDCGFWALVGVIGLDREFEIGVRALLDDGGIAEVARIRGRVGRLETGYVPTFRPAMVTSMGRTGTTYLMRLLISHPQIVSYPRFPYELRPAKYWLHAMRVLAEPANHVDSAHWATFKDDIWTVGNNPFYTAPLTDDPALFDWFSVTHARRLGAYVQSCIDDVYLRVAERTRSSQATLFAEKFQPDHIPAVAWTLYDGAREIVLVRDLRDVVCSVFAFAQTPEARRGFGLDGRSPEEYVAKIAADAQRLVAAVETRRDSVFLLRYEDLIARPRETLENVFGYLGVDNGFETVESVLAATAAPSEASRAHRTTTDELASVGRWRRDLAPDVADVATREFAEVHAALGYDV